MKRKTFGISDYITTKEAGRMFNKHELTISRIMKQYFKEGVDYRKLDDREQLLLRKDCIEDYYKDPSKFKEPRNSYSRKMLPDRFFRI